MLGGCDRLGEADWFRRTLKAGEDANLFVQRLLLTERTLAPRSTPRPTSRRGSSRTAPRIRRTGPTKALERRKFADYRLEVCGLVETPLKLSLAELRKLPSRTQITRHDCVEGWSCIGEWTGVPLSEILDRARLKPQARYVVFRCADTMDQGEDDGAEGDGTEDASSGGNANPAMTKQSGGGEDKRIPEASRPPREAPLATTRPFATTRASTSWTPSIPRPSSPTS